MKRMAWLAAVGIVVSLQTAIAQTLPGFAITKQTEEQTTYTSSDQATVLIASKLTVQAADIEAAMRRVAQGTATICPGLGQSVLTQSGSISVLQSKGTLSCRLIAAMGQDGAVAVLRISMPASKTDADIFAGKLLLAKIGAAIKSKPDSASPSPPVSSVTAQGTDVFRMVPVSARPIAMIQRPRYQYGGVVPVFKVTGFALFANGFALDGCDAFDPRRGPPTPALATRENDCTVLAWRRAGSSYILIDEDGKPEDPQEPILPFRKGERVDIDHRTSSGFSSGPVAVEGMVSVNASFSNELRLWPDGTIGTRATSGVTVSDNGIGGGGGRDTGLSMARYDLDGFLMAVTDANGTRFRLIGKKFEGSDLFIHLDGRLFWKDD